MDEVKPERKPVLIKPEANRRNAQHSTGPITPAGRQRSSRNARKHGLLSKDLVIPGESPAQFRSLIDSFYKYFQPDNPLEQMLVDRIIHCSWRLRRSARYEAAEFRPMTSQTTAPDLRDIGIDPKDLKHMLSEDEPKLSPQEIEQRLKNIKELEGVLETEPYIRADWHPAMFQAQGNAPDGFASNLVTICYDAEQAMHRNEPIEPFTTKLRQLIREEKSRLYAQLKERAEPKPSLRAESVFLSDEVMNRVLRYEGAIERQLYRAVNQLERLKRLRRGESVPAPLTGDLAIHM